MGFFKSIKKGFKKIGKGFKSAFKSIGKGVKSAMGKIGKFMGKIGIVGQLALMFTPVGAMMSNMFASIGNVAGGMFSKVTGALAKGGTLSQGAGTVLKAAGNFAKAGHSAFRTITDGVSSFVGEFSKTALKKIPGMENMFPKYLGSGSGVSDSFFSGPDSAWNRVQGEVQKNAASVLDNFNKAIGNTDKILTAGQQNLKLKAEAQVNTAATGATYDSKGFQVDGPKAPERFGFDSDYSKGIQMEIDAGRSNLTASTDGFIQDQTAFSGKDIVAEAGGIQIDKPEIEKSLLSRATDKVSASYKEWKGDRTFGEAVVDTGIDKVGEQITGLGDKVGSAIDTRVMQEIGLEQKPVQNIYQSSAYVPEFNMAPAGQYGSAEINDRAMQVQLSGGQFHMQNPYGFGAADYMRKMAIATGGTA